MFSCLFFIYACLFFLGDKILSRESVLKRKSFYKSKFFLIGVDAIQETHLKKVILLVSSVYMYLFYPDIT